MTGRRRVLAAALTVLSLLGFLVVPASADVTGDKLADVVTRGADGRLWLFTNDGSAAPANPYPWAGRQVVGSDWNFVDRMLFGDLSLDGRPDIIAREPFLQGGTLWVYHHDDSQPTSPWTKRIWAGIGWNIAVFITAGDVTGDGRPDIVTREADGRMWLYPHTGRTTGPPFDTRHVIGANWQHTTAMLLADVTDDSRPDVVARDTDGFLWIFPPPPALAAWNFDADTPYHAGAGWEAYDQLQLADVNGDSRPDVLARDTTGTLWIFPHTGAAPGTNPWPTRYPAGDWWTQYTAVLAN